MESSRPQNYLPNVGLTWQRLQILKAIYQNDQQNLHRLVGLSISLVAFLCITLHPFSGIHNLNIQIDSKALPRTKTQARCCKILV